MELFVVIPWRPIHQAGADTLRMQGRGEAECRMAQCPVLLLPRNQIKSSLGVPPKTREGRAMDELTKDKLVQRGLYRSAMTRDHVAAACCAVAAILRCE